MGKTICSVLSLLIMVGSGAADQVTLTAVKDSGFFAAVESGAIIPTPNNFGAHTHVPVGSANNLRLNRSVFEFDLSSIPSDATITAASFDFEVTLQGGDNGQAGVRFSLHRVTNSWDEGTGETNIGEPTFDGVSWTNRTATDLWDEPGGDFEAGSLGKTFVDGPNDYSISDPFLVIQLQEMIEGAVENYGFLLKADPEGVLGSAARVSTIEGENPAQLAVTYLDSNSNMQQVSLAAIKDSGFFAAVEESIVTPTPNNFGGHTHVPVGSANNLRLNRSVFEFDLSSIPNGATINTARFDFEVTLQGGLNGQAPVDFGLYRVTAAWDEGTGETNIGDPAGGPVHWFMRTATDPWLNLGGDFEETMLGSDFVDGPDDYSISSPELVSVIQDMVDGTIENYGFLLKAEPEGVLGSAARVSTQEGGNPVRLVLTYTQPGFILGDVNQDGLVNLLDVNPFVTLLVGGGFSCEADINQDGAVDLLDVAPFIDLLNGG